MAFITLLDKFEGPLDLMLHLIKEKKLDILDLDIDILVDQYILYLEKMDEFHLEIESEYLVELASLIEYKSKKLLPRPVKDEIEAEDPKTKLVQRLLEYQKYKEVASDLAKAYDDRTNLLAKPLSNINFNDDNNTQMIDGNPLDLYKVMKKIFMRIDLSKPKDIKYNQKELSIDDRILQIKSRLKDFKDTFSFEEIISDCKTKHEYIVSFLAILDLSKNHILVFNVDENDMIWFKRGNYE